VSRSAAGFASVGGRDWCIFIGTDDFTSAFWHARTNSLEANRELSAQAASLPVALVGCTPGRGQQRSRPSPQLNAGATARATTIDRSPAAHTAFHERLL